MKVKSLSRVRLFVTLWTVARQAPPSMGFSRQEYWSGLPFPSPGDLPNPGIEPGSPALQADALSSEPPGKPQPKQHRRVLFFFFTLFLALIICRLFKDGHSDSCGMTLHCIIDKELISKICKYITHTDQSSQQPNQKKKKKMARRCK